MGNYEIIKMDGLYVVFKYDTKYRAMRIFASYETLAEAKDGIRKDKEV